MSRNCSHCGSELDDGYLVEHTSEVYCDKECGVNDGIDESEWDEDISTSDILWTTWYNKED